MKFTQIISELEAQNLGYWGKRILTEIKYLQSISRVKNGKFDDLLQSVAENLISYYRNENEITKAVVQKTEEELKSAAQTAKQYKLKCVGHSHIDMNWQWGHAETVASTLSTLRTMLNFMKEFPQFKYSQSHAYIYKIVEMYDPEMLEEIKLRIREGRWEVNSSTWVEPDQNLPSEESLVRQVLYNNEYLESLLGIKPEAMKIGFHPDSFGHGYNIPEILSRCGIKYYYHARGCDRELAYTWKSSSGASLLTYREPFWFQLGIDPEMVLFVPQYCETYKVDTAMKLYGVCDHGGGPTREDLLKIFDMQTWPIFPEISIGHFLEYFKILESVQDYLPIYENELNFTFVGSYTTQSRLKMANRTSENSLYEAETLGVIAQNAGDFKRNAHMMKDAWHRALFNQFHDIVGGTGTIETREYSMGEFQKIMTKTTQQSHAAIQNLISKINTTGLLHAEPEVRHSFSRSEGGGVGFGTERYKISFAERGKGKERIYHVFNTLPYNRNELCPIQIWDYTGDLDNLEVITSDGKTLPCELVTDHHKWHYMGMQKEVEKQYWWHNYITLLVHLSVPACGFTTIVVRESEKRKTFPLSNEGWRVEIPVPRILENAYLRVVFDPKSYAIISLIDKECGREFVAKNRPCGVFRLIWEEDLDYMSAWTMGRYLYEENLNSTSMVSFVTCNTDGLRKWIRYKLQKENTKLEVTVSLDPDSHCLNYEIDCDWQEISQKGKYIPQLQFYVPFNFACEKFLCAISNGTIQRIPMEHDVPCNGWIAAKFGDTNLQLMAANKYGFRGEREAMSVSLLRSPYEPDLYPDIGLHSFRLGLAIGKATSKSEAIKQFDLFEKPLIFASNTMHQGELPTELSFLRLDSDGAKITAIKPAENGNGIIVRIYETDGQASKVTLTFNQLVLKAEITDSMEEAVQEECTTEKNSVQLSLTPYGLHTVRIHLKKDSTKE